MNLWTAIIFGLIVAASNAAGVIVQPLIARWYFNRKIKCTSCGKKWKQPQVMISTPCDDCLHKQAEDAKAQYQSGIVGGGIPVPFFEPPEDFTESLIKTYSDPRLIKTLRKAFKPQTELERLQELDDEEG